MRQLLLAVLIVLGFAATAQDRDGIQNAIGAQMQAFNERDLNEAWSYASPMIQRLFDNPENFGRMVAQGYPMVWDNRDVQFMQLDEIEGLWVQVLRLRDPAGTTHVLAYQMVEIAGKWRINGVSILPAQDLAA